MCGVPRGDVWRRCWCRYDHDEAWSANMELFKHFTDVTQGVRRLGAAAVDMCHVALGVADAYWEYRLKPWDVAAGVRMPHSSASGARLCWLCAVQLWKEQRSCGVVHTCSISPCHSILFVKAFAWNCHAGRLM